jgi:hypothetical protein
MKKRVLIALVISACSTTSILSTWTKPGLTGLHFNKVVVVVPLKDEGQRRRAEDEVVRALAPTLAVPSYTLVPAGANADQLRQQVAASGFDGAVILRVRAVDKEATWVPGTYGGPYYGWGAGGWYDPGYMRVDTYVRIETNVYAMPEEDLLWAATSRTANPSSLTKLTDETVAALRDELHKEGLTPTPVSRREAPSPAQARN